jgi:ribonuclease P protein component
VQRSKIFAPDRQTTSTHNSRKSQDPSSGCQRFHPNHRLPDQAAYSHVFGGASRSRDRLFTILSRRNHLDVARLGLAISKKQCRLATGRNRLKRIVRESFRQHLVALEGLDIVVLAQSGAAAADNRTLFDSLTKHWQKTRSAQFDARSDSQ